MDERIARAVMGALRERDRSGFELWRWIGPVHGAREVLSEATLYPILYRLEAERMIGGTWRETERTRRLYRLSSLGVDLVARRGWPVIAHRTELDPILTGAIAAKIPGSEAQAPAPADGIADPARTALIDGPRVESRAIDDYLDRLESDLRLSETDRTSVRDEIRHHIEDSRSSLVELGMESTAAATEAIARLGPPEDLAAAVNSAKLTRLRLVRGLRGASIAALFGGALGLAVAGTSIAFTPIIARFLSVLAGLVGVHLYAPENSVWWSQQLFLALSVAAFLAARRSLPLVALQTGRDESLVRPLWALAGGIPLLIFALVMPASLDALVVVALLAIPVGFVGGTWLSQGHEDDLVSRKGIAGAAVLLAVLLLAPGFRVWTFDPAAGPPAAPAPTSSATRIAWDSSNAGHNSWIVSAPGLDSASWRDAKLEFWPAIRQGVAIVPDSRATQPTFTALPGDTVDLSRFESSDNDWWVILTAVGSDGARRTLATDIHYGGPGAVPHNIISQMLGHT